MATPLHIQRLENALDMRPFTQYAEKVLKNEEEIENLEENGDSDGFEGIKRPTFEDKEIMYNAESVGEDRQWLYNLLLSETDSESSISDHEAYISDMLKNHVREKRYRKKYHQNPNVSKVRYLNVIFL